MHATSRATLPPADRRLGWLRLARRAGIALALLVATDLAVRSRLPPVRYDADFALPGSRLVGLGAYVAHLRARAAAGARVVVLLGDSTTCVRVPAGSPDLGGELARALAAEPGWPPVEVYNISAAGLDAASHYYLARELAPHVRAILFTINFRIFSTGRIARIPYPELWHELRAATDPEERSHLLLERGQGAGGRLGAVEGWLDDVANAGLILKRRPFESWAVLRGWVNPLGWMPGRGEAAAPGQGPAAEDMWNRPMVDWPTEARDRAMRYYAMSYRGRRFAPDNADVFFTQRTFALAKTSPCLLIGFLVPVSRWINARSPFLDWEDYAVNAGLVRALPAGPRNMLLDYNAPERAFDPAPGDRYFQSPEHMVHAGIRLFARRLLADVGPRLREAVRPRQAPGPRAQGALP